MPGVQTRKLVNISDAMYLTLEGRRTNWSQGNWISNASPSHFSKDLAPTLHELGKDRVPTYHDFVLGLAGKNLGDAAGKKTAGLQMQYSGSANHNMHSWGKTFGRYKGLNGRPIAESKALDKYFWYYDGFRRFLQYGWSVNDNTSIEDRNICRVDNWYYHWGVWKISTATISLAPGCYGASLRAQVNNAAAKPQLRYWLTVNGIAHDLLYLMLPGEIGTQYNANCIFFLDEPCSVSSKYDLLGGSWTNVAMEGNVFRITPPIEGYWEA